MRVPRSAILLALLLAGCDSDRLERFEYQEGHMGTTVRMVLHAPDRATADSAAADAFRTLARLDSLFSDYRTDSGIAAVAAAAPAPVPVAPELLAVLVEAQRWARATDGAFDITVGPATRLWRQAIRQGEPPPRARLDSVRALVGWGDLDVDTVAGTARLARPGMSLDLGGIAKGWAAQHLLERIQAGGIRAALVDAGGDVAVGDVAPRSAGWRVEFPGAEMFRLTRSAVATSGDRYQYLEVDGVRHSHILDPRTAMGVAGAPTVVVVAPDAATADVLASALTVLGPEAGRALVDTLPVAVRVTAPEGATGSWETEGFPRPGTGGGS